MQQSTWSGLGEQKTLVVAEGSLETMLEAFKAVMPHMLIVLRQKSGGASDVAQLELSLKTILREFHTLEAELSDFTSVLSAACRAIEQAEGKAYVLIDSRSPAATAALYTACLLKGAQPFTLSPGAPSPLPVAKSLELGENEKAVLLALLELGEATVREIASVVSLEKGRRGRPRRGEESGKAKEALVDYYIDKLRKLGLVKNSLRKANRQLIYLLTEEGESTARFIAAAEGYLAQPRIEVEA